MSSINLNVYDIKMGSLIISREKRAIQYPRDIGINGEPWRTGSPGPVYASGFDAADDFQGRAEALAEAASRAVTVGTHAGHSFETPTEETSSTQDEESKLLRDLGEHRQQRCPVGRPQELVEARLVLCGDEPFGSRQHRAALVGQHQDVGAAVIGRAHPRA